MNSNCKIIVIIVFLGQTNLQCTCKLVQHIHKLIDQAFINKNTMFEQTLIMNVNLIAYNKLI